MSKSENGANAKAALTIGPEDADVFLLNLHHVARPDFPLLPTAHLGGGGRSWPLFAQGEKLSQEEASNAPTILEFPFSEASNFGDFSEKKNALILSGRATEILERLEPGQHQIFPLKVQSSQRDSGQLEDMGHFLVHVYQQSQAINVLTSHLKREVMVLPAPHPTKTYYLLDLESSDRTPRLFSDGKKVRGKHLWRGTEGVLNLNFFVSRQLKEAWTAAGCGPMVYFACPSE